MKLSILTHSPSPYQVELFNALARSSEISLLVGYLFRRDPQRRWRTDRMEHPHVMLDQEGHRQAPESLSRLSEADLLIVNYYRAPIAQRLIRQRTAQSAPWVFWGERPGFHQPSALGRIFRLWKLRELHRAEAPIWGIGMFAVDGYRAEFGERRDYRDIPYFSNLERFLLTSRPKKRHPIRTVLFSGSLIRRKGVDLLANAFADIATGLPSLRLKIMGAGERRPLLEQSLAHVRRSVEFVGFKSWDELPSVYAQADILCVPSRYDGWGLVVPEGLAAGLPVIGTDRMGAALEFLETDRNGWLVHAGNEEQLRHALRAAATIPDERLAEMSATARATVTDHSLEKGVERFLRATRDAVANWGSRSQRCAG